MIRLNGVEYEYRPGQTLMDLMDHHNLGHAKVSFDGCVVIVGRTALTTDQAREKIIGDNETIFIVPALSGG